MDALTTDIRHRIRRLFNRLECGVVSSLSLAAGIGVCAVFFSIVNTVLLRQLPYRKADQIIEVKIRPTGRRANLCDPKFDPEVQSPYE